MERPERLRDRAIFLVAGEHSGDALGGPLMSALAARLGPGTRFVGVGGAAMQRAGLSSLFPLEDVAVMGPLAILKRLPHIVRRVHETVDAAIAADPDVVVVIDSPEFTHPIARRIRKRRPSIPIVDYVSPSVWAWRPGRARRMRAYVDHVLALLPFEPAVHQRLGGPPCTYVGHPLIERASWIAGLDPLRLAERLDLDAAKPVLVVLPGSRRSEVSRLMGPFGAAVGLSQAKGIDPYVLVPAVDSRRAEIAEAAASWPVRPMILTGDEDKFAAFKLANAALAASGTVTLELAMAGTPAVVAYKVDGMARHLRFLVKVPSIVLANLVLGENVYPELIQESCTPDKLAAALLPLIGSTPERSRQKDALRRISDRMQLSDGSPSEAAAAIVARYAETGRERPSA